MNVETKKFEEVTQLFPKLEPILKTLNDNKIKYSIGGSVALYVQGHGRKPNDVDFMFTDKSFDQVNKLLGLKPQHIERSYNSMNKSTPVDDGSVEFLNRYTAKADGHSYYSPPLETIPVRFKDSEVELILAEKIAVFKLISRRAHHSDLDDFHKLFQHAEFNIDIFWKIVDSLNAHKVVSDLLRKQI